MLHELAAACGVQAEYRDWRGEHVVVPPAAVMATLRALGIDIDREDQAADHLAAVVQSHEREARLPHCQVLWGDEPLRMGAGVPHGARFRMTLDLENGESWVEEGDARPGEQVYSTSPPHGYHRLTLEVDGETLTGHLLSAPEVAWRPDDGARRWGVFAPLYAVRSGSGAGNLGDLRRIAAWSTDRGAQLIGTLPLLAGFFEEPCEFSPYGPASRLFWNELYLDLDGLDAPRTADHTASAADLAARELVPYREQMALVRSRLEPVARKAWAERAGELEAALEARPDIADYARFRAVGDRHRDFWPTWPERERGGDIQPGDYDLDAWRYHAFAQLTVDRQLAELGGETELYLDLPVGVHRFGYDTWRDPGYFATGASAGAPPDALFAGGQNWGSPPLHPVAARRSGHAYFAASVRAHMRHASLLRVDHVIGMHRLYWVPDGMAATEGCFVRSQAHELYAVLTIESHRNRCAVAGEDLGTVPPELPPALERHGLDGLYVGQFVMPSDASWPLEDPRSTTVASLGTHDTPTFAGYWAGLEIDDRLSMGLLDDDEARRQHDSRSALRAATCTRFGVDAGGDPREAVLDAWHEQLARSPARVVLITLEDLLLEERPQNVPGTSSLERPNWRRRMARTLAEILGDARLGERLAAIGRARRG